MVHFTFTNKKYTRMLFAALLGWIVATVGETADSIIAGIYLGEDAVGAVELVAPVFNILFFASAFLANGTAVLFSRAAGKFDADKSKKMCGMGMSAALVLGGLMALIMTLCEDFYFNFYTSGPAIDMLAREYYDCFKLLAIIYPAYWVFYNLVAIDGDDINVFIVDFFTAISNVLISILLINRIGIYGLGIGTALSQVLSIGILSIHLFKKSNGIKFKLYFNWAEFKECCAIGSTGSMTTLYVAIIDIIMNKYIIMTFGDSYLAAYAVVNFIINMGACFMCAIESASPFISVAYGENNPAALKRAVNMADKSTGILGISFVIAAEALATVLPNLFGVTDPEVFAAAVYAGRVLGLSYIAICYVYETIKYLPLIEKFLLGNILGLNYMLITPLVFVLPLSAWVGWKGLVWGFFLTPFVSYLLEDLIILIKYGKKKVRYLIDETDDQIFIYELALTDQEIIETRDKAIKALQELGLDDAIINKLALTIEETFEIVKEKNAGKRILADCTITVSKNQVKLTTRDDGVIFDITDVDSEIKSLGSYVAGRIMQTTNESSYIVAISYNRNSYVWDIN